MVFAQFPLAAQPNRQRRVPSAMRRFFWPALALWVAPEIAHALPVAPTIFCERYPEAAACKTSLPACTLCHTIPPTRNRYGASISAALLPAAPRPLSASDFAEGLSAALAAVESADADGDQFSNLDEILAGAHPADPDSYPREGTCPLPGEQLGWNPCASDPSYTLKKVSLDFCGHSPTRAQMDAIKTASNPQEIIQQALATCLDTEHWRGQDGVLWNLANKKIKPVQSIKSGEGEGNIPLADYYDDYALFVYVSSDDRDAREMLTAQYFVERFPGPPTEYVPFNRSPIQDVSTRGQEVAQLVAANRRAGMLTARWFLMSNTMFTGVPRTTAAQAYRAYLGFDIAKMQGLSEIQGEPRDYDRKGVQATECARCHSTLDPLTYPFAYYSGIGGESGNVIPFSYVADRPDRFVNTDGPAMADVPEQGYIFGQPVANLVEWAQVAANSEHFARALVLDYWRFLLGQDPQPNQQAEFDELWQNFMSESGHNYRVEAMLRALVQTEAYSVP